MLSSSLTTWIEAVGLLLVVVGLGMVSLPLGLVSAGVFLVLAANLAASQGSPAVRPSDTAGNTRRAA